MKREYDQEILMKEHKNKGFQEFFLRAVIRSLLVSIASLGSISALAIPLIDTTGVSSGGLGSFGETNTATYGQTFTVTGAETVLDSFSFSFDDLNNPDAVDFAAYVYGWNGNRASGPQLYASSMLTSTNNGGSGGFETFDIDTNSLQLTSGSTYVAFFSSSNFFDGNTGTSSWRLSSSDVYAGGSFVFDNNGSNFGSLTTSNWDCATPCISGRDLLFTANFSVAAVPEPGVLFVFAMGLFGLISNRRRVLAS